MTTDAIPTETTARGRVREGIRKLILGGEFRPGERLTQQQLAKRFGVAQSVVRESLIELQFSGLVQSVDNLGIFVGELDARKLVEAYQVRELMEGLAARLCCERAGRADVRQLSEIAQRIQELGMEGKVAERGTLDRQFHLRMMQVSQNGVLARLAEAYHFLGMTVQAGRPEDEIFREHIGIVKAIEENRVEEAERLARSHVAESRKVIEGQIAGGKFVPKWVVD